MAETGSASIGLLILLLSGPSVNAISHQLYGVYDNMGDFADGMTVAERLIRCETRLAEHDARWLEHELSAGAHASAFDAHGQSPGPVEGAEETATAIIDHASDVAADTVEAVADAGEIVTDGIESAAEDAVEATEDAAEAIADASESVVPDGEGEREPANVHFLHRRWWGSKAS